MSIFHERISFNKNNYIFISLEINFTRCKLNSKIHQKKNLIQKFCQTCANYPSLPHTGKITRRGNMHFFVFPSSIFWV